MNVGLYGSGPILPGRHVVAHGANGPTRLSLRARFSDAAKSTQPAT